MPARWRVVPQYKNGKPKPAGQARLDALAAAKNKRRKRRRAAERQRLTGKAR